MTLRCFKNHFLFCFFTERKQYLQQYAEFCTHVRRSVQPGRLRSLPAESPSSQLRAYFRSSPSRDWIQRRPGPFNVVKNLHGFEVAGPCSPTHGSARSWHFLWWTIWNQLNFIFCVDTRESHSIGVGMFLLYYWKTVDILGYSESNVLRWSKKNPFECSKSLFTKIIIIISNSESLLKIILLFIVERSLDSEWKA